MALTHPLFRDFTPRLYQETIFASCSKKNSLVVLPTGMGKTMIAAMVAAFRLDRGKILFLAPTKPLVLQHKKTFEQLLTVSELEIFTGTTPPEKRQEGYAGARIICATPQVIENDLLAGRVNLKDFSLVIFDEAHRAVGDYAYVFIAKTYMRQAMNPLILGLTASPGSEEEQLRTVRENLYIENMEIRTEESSDVKPYIQNVDVEFVKVEFPEEFQKMKELLESVYRENIERLQSLNLLTRKNPNKVQLLQLQQQLFGRSRKPEPPPYIYPGLKALAAALKIQHAILLLETQGLEPLRLYFERLEKQKTKSAKEISQDFRIKRTLFLASQSTIIHPKFEKLREIVKQEAGKKIIVFSNYRDSAQKSVEILSEIEGVHPVRFVGQATKSRDVGLTQKRQKEIIESFREGKYDILVATSVAEEGLDIPQVDIVIFYEPVPSEIRLIQRRGRTGRQAPGRVIVLVTKGTRDENYSYISRRRERKMKALIEEARTTPVSREGTQTDLGDFIPSIKIICDNRENPSILKKLSEHSAIETRQLSCADYILSDRVACERKTCEDFLNSLVDGRLFSQVKELRQTYRYPMLILEGENLYSARKIHPNAIQSALVTVMLDFGVPVIFSRDEDETVSFLYNIARREQEEGKREVVYRTEKRAYTLEERQRFVVESLPNVSSILAQRLLEHFGTIKEIVNAGENELQEVEGIGKKIAAEIREVLEGKYKSAKLK